MLLISPTQSHLKNKPAGTLFSRVPIACPRSQALCLGIISIGTLPALSAIKHRHPWNLLGTGAWSVLFAVFVAASDLPGAYFKSHALFLLLSELAGGVILLIVLAQVRPSRDGLRLLRTVACTC